MLHHVFCCRWSDVTGFKVRGWFPVVSGTCFTTGHLSCANVQRNIHPETPESGRCGCVGFLLQTTSPLKGEISMEPMHRWGTAFWMLCQFWNRLKPIAPYTSSWFGTFFIFPYIGNVIIPTDFNSIIFQRGGEKPPTRPIIIWLILIIDYHRFTIDLP